MRKLKNIILKEGGSLIADDGIKSFTVENLATRLFMSKKTIYQCFSTKEALIKGIIVFKLKKQSEGFEKVMESEADPINKFYKIRDLHIKFSNKINLKRLVYIKTRYPKIWDIIEKYRSERIENFTKIFLLAKKKGYLRETLDPIVSAKLFVNILNTSFRPEFILKNNINIKEAIYHIQEIVISGFFNKKLHKKIT